MTKKQETKLTNAVRRCAIALLMAEAELMEAPLTKKQAAEAFDSSNLLDEAHNTVHQFHNSAPLVAEDNTGKQEFDVTFTAQFKTKVFVAERESLSDAVSDVDIPESKDTKYIEQTFEIDSVEDMKGNDIDVEAFDKERQEEQDEDDDVQEHKDRKNGLYGDE